MAYAYFVGCIAPLRFPGIESATREVFKALNIDLIDMEGASCCPAPGVFRSFDRTSWLAVGARNLVIAEKNDIDILTICNGCYASLFEVAEELNENEETREKINKVLAEAGLEYNGTTEVKHFAKVIYDEAGPEKVASLVKEKQPINVAVEYGCHFLKPSKSKNIDNPENPRILDELVEAVGATSVNYMDKMTCCGAGGGVRAREGELSTKMAKGKLDNMKAAGAQCIVDVCPFCHLQYVQSQKQLGDGYNLPVLHLSQLYGLAFGIDRTKLGIADNALIVDHADDACD